MACAAEPEEGGFFSLLSVPVLKKELQAGHDEEMVGLVSGGNMKFAQSKADKEPWTSACEAFMKHEFQ